MTFKLKIIFQPLFVHSLPRCRISKTDVLVICHHRYYTTTYFQIRNSRMFSGTEPANVVADFPELL